MKKAHNIEDIYALSPVQEGMLFSTLSNPSCGMYLNQYHFEISGPLDQEAFVQAWEYILARHTILRTACVWNNSQKTFQLVFKHLTLPLQKYDWRLYRKEEQQQRLQELLHADLLQDFELTRPPLMRLKLIILQEYLFSVIWTSHHLILDGWSRAIVVKELIAAYKAYQQKEAIFLPSSPQYKAFIHWLQRDFPEAEGYWRESLKGITAPTQLANRQEKREQRPLQNTNVQERLLSIPLTTRLQELAQKQETTLNILALAAWALVLHTQSQQDHIVFGVTTAGRPYDLPGIEQLVGLFINTLPLHLEVSPLLSLSEWIQQVQQRQRDLLEYQYVPISKIHEWSSIPRELPLFESSFVFYNYPLDLDLQQIALGNGVLLQRQGHRGIDLSPLPLVMMVHPAEKQKQLVLRLAYDTTDFRSDYITQLLARMSHFLEQMIVDFHQRIDQLSLLTPEEQKVLNAVNTHTTLDVSTVCWSHLFAERVKQQPDAIALTEETRQLTYQALDRRAEALASSLRKMGVRSETVVGLSMERGLNFITALIAIFKAGGAACPLDLRYPLTRQAQMIIQSGARFVLCDANAVRPLQNLLSQQHMDSILLMTYTELSQYSEGDPCHERLPGSVHSLAYILFTSGSTGRPKAVMIEQGGMLNHMWAKLRDLHITQTDRIAQNGSAGFDVVIWQSLAVLLVGGCVCVFNDEIVSDPVLLCSRLEQAGISILQIVPSLLRLLLPVAISERIPFSTLRWLVPTGEALPGNLTQQWCQYYAAIPLLNTYGSTECSDDQCHYVIESHMEQEMRLPIMPIGYPIGNLRTYILNHQLQPLPIGVSGELYIGGKGVGRGYLDQPIATAERFLPDPFSLESGERMYKTGDLARYLEDGRIEFLHRADQQIKIQGFRVELGEIESVLANHSAVQACAVIAQTMADTSRNLVAYVVPHTGIVTSEDGKPKSAFVDLVEQQITEWQEIYDERYSRGHISPIDPLTHFATWINSYTGQPFSQEEVSACIDDSSRCILALQPRRVLEIGCGSGLIARQLLPYCEHYTGTDIAEHGLASLQDYLETLPDRRASITLLQRAAHNVNDFAPESFDVIVLNEVIQYFPHISYLYQVLSDLLPIIQPGGMIFLGDIRSLPHLSLFHFSLGLQAANSSLTLKELQQQIDKNVAREKELVIAPEFFLALPQYFPQIASVSIQYKFGAYDNEFTCFRYHVLLRIAGSEPTSTETKATEAENGRQGYDWQKEQLSLSSLHLLLQKEQPGSILLHHVPNGRISRDCKAQEFLTLFDAQQTVAELRAYLQQHMPVETGLHPDAFRLLGDTTGYITEVLWEPHSTATFSVHYTRPTLPRTYSYQRPYTQEATHMPSWHDYANSPVMHAIAENLIPQLRHYLQENLPTYMVPGRFVLLDSLPLSSNGKLDQHRLPLPDMQRPETGGLYVPATTSIEQLVAQIWQRVLGIDRIGIHDNFFALGGHSLLATQILSRLRATFRTDLSLRDLFQQPTVAGVVQVLQQREPEPEHLTKIAQAFERFQSLSEHEKQLLAHEKHSK